MMRNRERAVPPRKAFLFCFSLQAGVITYTSIVFIVMICSVLHNLTAENRFSTRSYGYGIMFFYAAANLFSLMFVSTGAFLFNERIIFFGSCLLTIIACLWVILSLLSLMHFMPAYKFLCVDERCPTTHWLFDEGFRSHAADCKSRPKRPARAQEATDEGESSPSNSPTAGESAAGDLNSETIMPTKEQSNTTGASVKLRKMVLETKAAIMPTKAQSNTTGASTKLRKMQFKTKAATKIPFSTPTKTVNFIASSDIAKPQSELTATIMPERQEGEFVGETALDTKTSRISTSNVPAISTATKTMSLISSSPDTVKSQPGSMRLDTVLDTTSVPNRIPEVGRLLSQTDKAGLMENVKTTVNSTAIVGIGETTGTNNPDSTAITSASNVDDEKPEIQTTVSNPRWNDTSYERIVSPSENPSNEFSATETVITKNASVDKNEYEDEIPQQTAATSLRASPHTVTEIQSEPSHAKFAWRTTLDGAVTSGNAELPSSNTNESNSSTQQPHVNELTHKYIHLILNLLKSWGVIYKIAAKTGEEAHSEIPEQQKTEKRSPVVALVSFEARYEIPRKYCSFTYLNFLWTLTLFLMYAGFTAYGLWTCFVFAKELKSKKESSVESYSK